MKYYLVAILTKQQLNQLTYQSDLLLQPGQFVEVELKDKKLPAIVLKETKKPSFAVKPINAVFEAEPVLPEHLLALADWMKDYYATSDSTVFKTIVPSGIGRSRRNSKKQGGKQISTQRSQLALTQDQANVIKNIQQSSTTAWIHGETGSGKTRIYVELVEQKLKAGKDCTVLVPEISLTPQLISQFESLSDAANIFEVHSKITPARRHTMWQQIGKSEKPSLIIGARSALFMPTQNLGLIIVDEAHENSYFQDQHPKYDALRVAAQLSKLTKAQLVLGSATPPVGELYLAEKSGVNIIKLKNPIHKHEKQIELVDLRDKKLFSKHRYLSSQLLESIQASLDNSHQALLLLNRRGTRQYASCQNCGWFAECPNCHIPLRFHHDQHLYKCHLCGHQERVPTVCPSCKQPEITYMGLGTKQLEIDIQKQFPSAKIVRYDQDAISASFTHKDMYKKLTGKQTDIIIGTQLVAKGLDLPRVSTIGVINADTSLLLPDYSASERTFQMLYQVSGRAGRSGLDSHVVIQTYLPDNTAIQAASARDYDSFYENELKQREVSQLPPFVFLLKLVCEAKSASSADEKAKKLAHSLSSSKSNVAVFGPTPAFHEYSRGNYRRQLIVKSKNRSALVNIAKNLPSGWNFELDPPDLL